MVYTFRHPDKPFQAVFCIGCAPVWYGLPLAGRFTRILSSGSDLKTAKLDTLRHFAKSVTCFIY